MTWFAWLMIIGYILLSISLYKVFEKAGEEGWKGLVPGYNFVVWCKLIGRPGWWAALLLIPIVNVFIYSGMAVDMVRSFGKYRFRDSFLAVIAAPFYFFYLGFKEEEKYISPILPRERAYMAKVEEARQRDNKRILAKLEKENPYKKSNSRDWAEALIFAIFAAALIRLFLIEAYVIPTPSMEGSLMVGDFLFVSKAHYGIRMPQTVAMIPLLHNRVPVVGGESYWEKPSLPYRRLKGLETIDHNDPVVFNLPSGDSVYIFPERTWSIADFRYGMIREANPRYQQMIETGKKELVTRPLDKRDHYIKRCVGMPGDTLEIRDRQVFLNGAAAENPTNIQFYYVVTYPGGNLNTRSFADWGISEDDVNRTQNPNIYLMFLTNEQKEKVQAMDASITIENVRFPDDPSDPNYNSFRLFPNDPAHFGPWTVDNYGPIWIPKAGATIAINQENIALFARAIGVYEGNDLEINGDQISINGEVATEYTFKMDYYWMMGDNRHNSEDSRVWGYVPADHIVGKPLFIWFSLREGSIKKGINWSRIFTSADRR